MLREGSVESRASRGSANGGGRGRGPRQKKGENRVAMMRVVVEGSEGWPIKRFWRLDGEG